MKITIFHHEDGFVTPSITLGGVKKLWTDEDYLYTTIHDTRKRRLSDVKGLIIEDEVAPTFRAEAQDK